MTSFETSNEIATAKIRLAAAKTNESSALKAVSSQRAMLEMMMRNMAVAQSRLKSSQREVMEAEKLLEEAEKRMEASFLMVDRFRFAGDAQGSYAAIARAVPVTSSDEPNTAPEAEGFHTGMKQTTATTNIVTPNQEHTTHPSIDQAAIDQATQLPWPSMGVEPRRVSLAITDQVESSSLTTSPSQDRRAASADSASQIPRSPPARQQQQAGSSGISSSPNAVATLQKHLLNLGSEAKLILREVVLSAILHPKGEVDPKMLQRAIEKGLPRHAVLNAAALARSRNRRNQNCTRSRMERQLSVRKGGPQAAAADGGGTRMSPIIRRAKSDSPRNPSVVKFALPKKGDSSSSVHHTHCSEVLQKGTYSKAA